MIYMYIYSTRTFLYTYMYTSYIESHMYYKYDIHVHIAHVLSYTHICIHAI